MRPVPRLKWTAFVLAVLWAGAANRSAAAEKTPDEIPPGAKISPVSPARPNPADARLLKPGGANLLKPAPPLYLREFTPHAGIVARTEPWGGVSFQRVPGANLNTPIFLNALTVAVAPRVEIGTSPLLWFAPQHRWNANVKANVYSSQELDVAVGLSGSQWAMGTFENYDIGSAVVSANFKPRLERIWFGVFFGVSETHYTTIIYDNAGIYPGGRDFSRVIETGADASLHHGVFDFTLGIARLRDLGFSSLEDSRWGGGLTVAWYRPRKFFSKPALGFHFVPSTGNGSFLFSTTFY